MPIPDYEKIMLPLLIALADGQEHSAKEVRGRVAEYFHLTPEELAALQPSGRMPLYNNRFHWARLYLDKARVIATPRRGWYRLTPRGRDILQVGRSSIDVPFLMQFPELVEFLGRGTDGDEGRPQRDQATAATIPVSRTPDEVMQESYFSLRRAVESDLLQQVLSASPPFFEDLVIKLLVAMGYGGSLRDAGEAIGRTGDGGIDGKIKEDKLGLDIIYVQAKRWQNTVGAREIRDFAGSIDAEHARKGIFLTTSTFSHDAQEYVRTSPKRIVLINGETLSRLMFDHGVGVTTESIYELKRVDSDFFFEE